MPFGPLGRLGFNASMFSFPTDIEEGLSHIELATVVFDQWNLNVSIRKYRNDTVVGMAQITFPSVLGFRYLSEGDMLMYNFPNNAGKHYLHHIESGGWLDQELAYKNTVFLESAKEFLVAPEVECLCVISSEEPILLRSKE